tara:strand:- start:44 stop:250 length:207 start_codon:yes stop_codon:yes gene_type:complete
MAKNIQTSQMHNVERIKIQRRVTEAEDSPTNEEYWVTDIILYLDNNTCIEYSLFSDHNSIPIDIDPTG